MRHLVSFRQRAAGFASAAMSKGLALCSMVAAGIATLFYSGLAAASTTPGGAIAADLSGGEADMGLVFAAVAVLIGVLLVWSYVRRSAR